MSAELPVPLALPSRSERTYLETFNIAAIAVFAAAAGAPVAIVATADLETALTATRRSWPREDPPILASALWAKTLRAAQQISNLALANDLRLVSRANGRLAVDVEMAVKVVEAAAVRLNVTLVPHATVLDRARLASAALGGKLDEVQGAGRLKQFNKEYRRRRQAAQAQGREFVPYVSARARLERALAVAAQDGTKVSFDQIFNTLEVRDEVGTLP